MGFKNKIRRIVTLIIVSFILISIGIIFLAAKYPLAYRNIVVKYSEEYEVDPFLIASIINVESRYDKLALSSKEAKGLMQISPQTGQWASEVLKIQDYKEDDLFQPDLNIRIGTWYIDRLFKEFDGNLEFVLAAYNAGSGNVNKWIADKEYCVDGNNLEKIPFKETEDYLVRVKKNYKVYSRLYKNYLFNWEDKDSFYINFLHTIKRMVEGMKKI